MTTPILLGELLQRSSRVASVDQSADYQEITVRMKGKGVVPRGVVSGAQVGGRRFVARSGQFIISRIDARNGANGLVPEELNGALVTNDFPLFDIDVSRLHPPYLQWLGRTAQFVDMCRRASEGTTNRVRLSETKFMSLEVRLPSLSEQRRLTLWIEDLASRSAKVQSLQLDQILTLEQVLASAYQKIAVDAPLAPMRVVAPIARRPVALDFSASYAELGVRSFFKGTFHKPMLSAIEIGSKRIFQIEPGDLIFNNVFAWEGAIAIATPDDAARVGSHRFITCVVDPKLATARFLLQHFRSERGLSDIQAASPGGAGRNRTLGLGALEAISVPVPSLEKQQWFSDLHRQVERVIRERASLRPLYDAILPAVLSKAFTGCSVAAPGYQAPKRRASNKRASVQTR